MRRSKMATCAVLLLAPVLVACGSSGPPPESPVLRSQALLFEPPLCALVGSIGDVAFQSPGNSPVLTFHAPTEHSITVPGTRVLSTAIVERSGTLYLVAASLDQDESLLLYRYHDVTADGLPDASTEVLLLDSGTIVVYGMSMGFLGSSRLLILDAKCQDVLLAEDTDSDGWVDELQSTPFAMADNFSDLLQVTWILPVEGDQLSLLAGVGPQIRAEDFGPGRDASVYWFQDLSGADDIADTQSTRSPEEVMPLVGFPYPSAGDQSVAVSARLGPTTMTVEVWSIDSEGEDVEQLGGLQLSGQTGSVPLSRALVVDERLSLRYMGVDDFKTLVSVASATPQVLAVSPDAVANQTVTVVNLTGVRFSQDMDIYYEAEVGVPVELAHVFVDSEHASVTLPALTGPLSVKIYAIANGQSVEEPVGVRRVFVDEP